MPSQTRDARGLETSRRDFLHCMAWAGTGLLWTLSGGILSSRALAEATSAAAASAGDLHFVQISDTHIGFGKPVNPNPVATAREAIRRVNALSERPLFMLHTGDLSHTQKPAEFEIAAELLGEAKVGRVFTVPGEHDVFDDDGREYLGRFARGTLGSGWRSFDIHGAHFVGLVNVLSFRSGGVGRLGAAQLEWLRKDLEGLPASTPVVVFAHIPLWALYPEWGWATDDGEEALALLRRFGSVTVLNGHIHQVLQKVEGNVTFHTALSTAYPQPAPGTAPGPGPLHVSADQLRRLLGLREITWRGGPGPLAVVDSNLG